VNLFDSARTKQSLTERSAERTGAVADAHALSTIEDFRAKTSPGAFKKLSRSKIADGLKARLDKPELINQGQAGLCGPASFIYELAKAKPRDYVGAATNLYDIGGTNISKLALKPSDDLLAAEAPKDVDEADWSLCASLRDCENWFKSYHKESDDGGTTNDEVEKWLKDAGFKDVQTDTFSTNLTDHESNLKKAKDLYKKGYYVIWSICACVIDSSLRDSPSPDHFVVMNGDFTIPSSRNDTVSIPIFTWGKKVTIPRVGGLKYGQFLTHYFGYLAAKF
jgi:hypothetical protein